MHLILVTKPHLQNDKDVGSLQGGEDPEDWFWPNHRDCTTSVEICKTWYQAPVREGNIPTFVTSDRIVWGVV